MSLTIIFGCPHKNCPVRLKRRVHRGQAVEEKIKIDNVEMWNIDFIDNIIMFILCIKFM